MFKLTEAEKTVGIMMLISYLFVMISVYFDKDAFVYKNIWVSIGITIITVILFIANIYICRKED